MNFQPMNNYSFGAIQMGKRGMACHYPMEKLIPKIQALTIEQAREAYDDASEQLKSAKATLKRFSNISIHGWGTYEHAAQQAYMAEIVMSAILSHQKA